MGNNRQQLKDNIQSDLHKKIQEAESVLTQLKNSVDSVEHNSAQAKGELQDQMDAIQQLLTFRKFELTRQIELISQSQINVLQEGIRSTYITLGSLQSTLSHLDSFDLSQLINLRVPEYPWMQNVKVSQSLDINIDDNHLKEEIEKWGHVSSSANECSSVTNAVNPTPMSTSVQRKSLSSASTSSVTFQNRAKTPVQGQNVFKDTRDCSSPDKWHVEQWLDEIKTVPCVDNEDFEIVSFEVASTDAPKLQMNANSMDTNNVLRQIDSNITEDGGSSIVCVDKEDTMSQVSSSDLAQWLKPKKKQNTPNENQTVAIQDVPSPIPSAESPKPACTKRCNPATTSLIDFPCLELDPKCWIKEKRTKRCFSTELQLSISQNEIIPPTYALPNPFWLKRFC